MLAVNVAPAADQEAGTQASKRNTALCAVYAPNWCRPSEQDDVQVQKGLSARYVVWQDLLKSAQPRPKLGCKHASRI